MILTARDRAGAIHVFLNSCRHRGMKVCRYDEGTTAVFTCPYHGWSYGTDGRLVGVPYLPRGLPFKARQGETPLSRWRSCATYKGSIWATWDKAAPVVPRNISAISPRHLDLQLDAGTGARRRRKSSGGVQKWLVPCNWKFPAENFSGDTYHNISHRSVDLAGIGPSGRRPPRHGRARCLAQAACLPSPTAGTRNPLSGCLPGDPRPWPAYQNAPIVAEYFAHCEAREAPSGGAITAVWSGRRARSSLNTAPLCRASRATMAGAAPAPTEPDRGVALVLCRPRRAERGQGVPARLLHPLVWPGRDDRAGRHGKLELRPQGGARGGRAAPSLQLRSRHGHGGCRISNGRGSRCRATSSTSPRCNRASSRCGICTGAGTSS